MNGIELERIHMSLVIDILNGTDISPPSKRIVTYRGFKTRKLSGVSKTKIGKRDTWRAWTTRDNKMVSLGEFPSEGRALLSVRLYRFWRKRGYEDIPNKTEKRQYRRW